MNNTYDIDFVVPWVDGSDPEWITEFNKYCPLDKRIIDADDVRYRDFGFLKYWFRGVEKFAPWVRKIHFITCGQLPTWINLKAPKLNFVKHSDYINSEYLPVFNSHPIEIMMKNISDLAEHFVYFNDDFYLTDFVSKDFFFKNGLPCDTAALNIIPCTDFMGHIILNNLDVINKYYNTRSVLRNNLNKWLSLKNGKTILRTLFLSPWPRFSGFYDTHFAQPYLKSVLETVWSQSPDELNRTMKSRFRSITDVNQWVFRYWQLCTGKFIPVSLNNKKYFSLTDSENEIANAIKMQKYKEIVINDGDCENVAIKKQIIKDAFEYILPDKSSFEI